MEGISPLSVLSASLVCEAEQLSQRCHCAHSHLCKSTERSVSTSPWGNPITSGSVQSCSFFKLARTDFSYTPSLSLFICTQMFTDPSITLSLSNNRARLPLAWSTTQTLSVSKRSSSPCWLIQPEVHLQITPAPVQNREQAHMKTSG